MYQSSVLVTSHNDSLGQAHDLLRRLEHAWDDSKSCRFTAAAFDDLNDVLDNHTIDGVFFFFDHKNDPAATYDVLRRLEDANVATIVLTDDDHVNDQLLALSNAIIDRVDTEPAMLCRTLRGVLHSKATVRQLREELKLTQRFQGGLRGEMARLHDEMQLAGMVQRELMPSAPTSLLGVEFATLWRPSSYVSGDIYDIKRLDEEHVGVFLADAIGHGVPAALMTMIIARAVQMKEIDGDSYRIIPPSEILQRLNADLVQRQRESTRFVTAICAVINCRTRHMQLAGAGHPPPLVLSNNGAMRELITPGGLLGVFSNETFDQIDVELDVHDRVLIYSDGFELAFPQPTQGTPETQMPTTRYRDEFDRLRGIHDPERFIEHLGSRVDAQPGSLQQTDDLTLICMHAGVCEHVESAHQSTAATSAAPSRPAA